MFIQSPNGGPWWQITVNENGEVVTTQATSRVPIVSGAAGVGITPGSPFAEDITASDVLTAVAQDVRNQLPADSPILLDYLDRVQRQVLRASKWRFLLSPPQTFNTVPGVSTYWVGDVNLAPAGMENTQLDLLDVYTIKRDSVRDMTGFTNLAGTDESPLGPSWKQPGQPIQWQVDLNIPYVLSLYPAPLDVHTLEFRYYRQRRSITAVTDPLQIPWDYKDILIAGVNAYAFEFLRDSAQASVWASAFQQGLREMVKDRNLYQATQADFIRPPQ